MELDGRPLPDPEAREIWTAFSVHMDAHEGDFDGFAKSRGYRSSRPEFRGGRAILVIKK